MDTEEDDFSRVVANLTHELKTPLHSILAIASVLDSEVDGVLNDEQRRQVVMITRNGEQLLELIIELLQFSSTSTSTRKLNLRRVSIRSFFENIVEGLRPLAAKSEVSIVCEVEKLAEFFTTDKTLLHRIFGNLLSNAVKFSPDGGEVSFYAETGKDGVLRAQVTDSGIGMDQETLQSIFGQFYQQDSADNRRFGGVGLGLSLVKKSLDLLGGTIEVQSEPNQGSLFSISIPSAEGAVQKRKILILDEDETIQLSLTECFRAEGYESLTVDFTRDLLAQVAESEPDLVMLAVQSTEGSSFELLRLIRASAWGKGIPVVLMSSLDGPQERAKGFEAGASDFIVKPFGLGELLARVRSQLERPW